MQDTIISWFINIIARFNDSLLEMWLQAIIETFIIIEAFYIWLHKGPTGMT